MAWHGTAPRQTAVAELGDAIAARPDRWGRTWGAQQGPHVQTIAGHVDRGRAEQPGVAPVVAGRLGFTTSACRRTLRRLGATARHRPPPHRERERDPNGTRADQINTRTRSTACTPAPCQVQIRLHIPSSTCIRVLRRPGIPIHLHTTSSIYVRVPLRPGIPIHLHTTSSTDIRVPLRPGIPIHLHTTSSTDIRVPL
ncbi:hypothetical protein B2J93_2515 [Marssonina coronariae]|uniref:Uncharacterized protein n=1 Tax=Diplocarpon coronariae TaxID=2795749 RepID=A0A218ZE30_9HELO|nr:hypothetical protein B2J93_2515 [Marssonina coronariae]